MVLLTCLESKYHVKIEGDFLNTCASLMTAVRSRMRGDASKLSGEDGTEARVQSNQEKNTKDEVSDKYSDAKANVTEGKIDYLFGQATGQSHNINRAKQNALQMERLGVDDTLQGHQMVRAHLEKVALDKSNVKATYSDQYGDYEVKESLFAGPSGKFAKFESTWEVTPNGDYRLTTVIPYGGGKKK